MTRSWFFALVVACRTADAPHQPEPVPPVDAGTSADAVPDAAESGAGPAAATVASTPPPLSWPSKPDVGDLDAQGHLCLPRSSKGVCIKEVHDASLCPLPSCTLALRSQPQGACCFAPRFRTDGYHRCAYAEETEGAPKALGCKEHIAQAACPLCSSDFDGKETERVRQSVSHACCYVIHGDY